MTDHQKSKSLSAVEAAELEPAGEMRQREMLQPYYMVQSEPTQMSEEYQM